MGSRVRRSRAEKAQAVALAREVGVAEAGRRLGIPPGSISKWRHHGTGADASEPEGPRRRGAELPDLERLEASLRTTQDAYDRAVRTGHHAAVGRLAVGIGVHVDKIAIVRRERTGARAGGGSDAREQAIRTITELRDRIVAERRERLHVQLRSGPQGDGEVAAWWLGFVGCDRGEPERGGWRRPAGPEAWESPHTRAVPVRREPVPVVVRPVVVEPELEDEEPVEAEVVVELPRRRALPRAGATAFAPGSVQRLIGGWGGSDG